METRIYSIRWFAALLLTLIVLGQPAFAKEVSASASLSYEETAVGEAVELTVTVEGSRNSSSPEIAVDGLQIQYVGPQTRIEMNNFDVSSSITHTYAVIPQREGTFTIPALKIDVGGRKLSTQPLKLVVKGGGATNVPGSEDSGEASDSRMAFAEWVVPKTTAYIGETVPAELRLYVASQVQMSLQHHPIVSGDGFTVQPMPKNPKITRIIRNGRSYEMVIFKTALTAVKAGHLKLEPTEINAVAQMQRRRAQRPRGFPDVFNDPFFDNAFGTVSQPVIIKADALEMEIKPLPVAGRPKGFSGAIGQFTFETQASPLQVKAGDPVTVTATVSGVGSFDRMGPPVAEETAGWRAYPPSSKFKSEDDIGISGSKTFEFAMIADRPQTALPKIEFSFFDPAKEQYVTLTGDPAAVVVEGAAAPSPTPSVAATSTTAPAAKQEEAARANDILFIRSDAGSWGASFAPVWRTPVFWFGQLIPLAALLFGAGWSWRSARLGDVRARQVAVLRQEKAAAVRLLRQPDTAPDRFYAAAVRALQLEAALRDASLIPETLDAETLCASRSLDAETAREIRALFAAHDELHYAGAGASSGEGVPAERRSHVLRTLEQFEKSHA